MSHRHRRSLSIALLAVAAAGLAACATPSASDAPPGASLGSHWPAPPQGDVVGVGTVMDVGGSVELCLGPVAESYPPQCSGLPVQGWTWEGVEGSETSADTTWGAYAVQGTYDGETFTVTQPPVMLALYDPMMIEDPTGGEPGSTDEATLLRIQEEMPAALGDAYLSSSPQDGRLWVDVVWDDGTWQQAADDDYGTDIVVIRSALRETTG
ncbi:hypothetical protein [Microbacterium sp. CPCC 204701]|uniref:hypothetical protein n=1 Tax=Microbacterium sp. CPCC 204701 TaxID=2493084 RepID=UPI000FDAF9C7|nr:hypothetical protein [Microbacterium sp. CPCC 204701]